MLTHVHCIECGLPLVFTHKEYWAADLKWLCDDCFDALMPKCEVSNWRMVALERRVNELENELAMIKLDHKYGQKEAK